MCLVSCWAAWLICESISYSVCLPVCVFIDVRALLWITHITQLQFRSIYQPPCDFPLRPVKTTWLRLKPFEWNISRLIFGCPGRPPAPRPIPTHPPGTGCPATLADWVSRVKKGSGTGSRNQITPIDHLLSALLWELRPRPRNQSPAIMSERGLLRTQGSRERHGRLCVVARSDIPYLTSLCDAATVLTSDCNWRPALESAGLVSEGVYRQALHIQRRSCSVVTYYQMLWDMGDLFKVISCNFDWHTSIKMCRVWREEGGGTSGGWWYSKCHLLHPQCGTPLVSQQEGDTLDWCLTEHFNVIILCWL